MDRRYLSRLIAAFTVAYSASIVATALEPDPDAPALNILFLGNSYTANGRINERVQTLATAAGWATPHVVRSTPGGHQLWEHANSNPIAAGPSGPGSVWDVVVLQEQSQLPANPSGKFTFYSGALSLYDQVQAHNPNARVVLYQTWARHANWDFSSGYFIGNDPIDNQDRLTDSYNYAAETHIPGNSTAVDKEDVSVAQVGEAWEDSYIAQPDYRLHTGDNSHPNAKGSYIASLMIYSEIYLTGIDGLPSAGLNVNTSDIDYLQGIVRSLVPDAYTRVAGDADDNGVVDQADLDFVNDNFGNTTERLLGGDLTGDGLVDETDRRQVVDTFSSLHGDFNHDGTVDTADYTLWRDNSSVTNGPLFGPGDANGDGNVDTLDYDVWRANYGSSIDLSASMSTPPVAVPEPGAAVLLAVAFTLGGVFRSEQ